MIFPFLKKDLLIFLRNKQELLILLGMPILLISILGFALKGFISGESMDFETHAVLVHHGNEQEDIDRFIEKVESAHLPEEEKQAMIAGTLQLHPVKILTDEVFGSEKVKEFVEFDTAPPRKLEQLKADKNLSAIIEVPEHFTLDVLESVFLGEEPKAELKLYKNEGSEISAGIVEEILFQFQKHFSWITILEGSGIHAEMLDDIAEGAIETVSEKEPINSMQYYTVGMSAMFILFIAASVSSFAWREKQQHVYSRILLSNTSKWHYFSGVFLSTMVIAILQQLILYGVAAAVFQVHWENTAGLLSVILSMGFATGGLASILTAINFRSDTESASNFFGNIFVALLSFFGGSFVPVSDFSPIIKWIGDLTPNGAGMTSLLQILQGAEICDVLHHIIYLIIFGKATIAVAVVIFPKRGKTV